MYRFWQSLIEPILIRLQPRTIVEIGSFRGQNTSKLLEFCRQHGAVLHAIDPVPELDVAAWHAEHGDRFVFHAAKSHDALAEMEPADIYLVDGDHNWYTVYHELRLIDDAARANGRDFPVVLFHDIGWPYARRDLYYNPDDIPIAYRKPYEKMGLRPDSEPLGEYGLNTHLFNATTEGGERNGVLTAIEDFLGERDEPLKLITIDGFSGLGILISHTLPERAPELGAYLETLAAGHQLLSSHIQALERERIETLIRMQRVRRRLTRTERTLTRARETGTARQNTRSNGRQRRQRPDAPSPARDADDGGDEPRPDVEIIVCVHNALADVQRCLESVTRWSVPGQRVILVDDGSDPPCRGYLASFAQAHPGTLLIRHDQATGFTRAANRGLRASIAPAVVLLNSDTVVTPHWLERLLECAQSSPRIGLVGPLTNHGSFQSVPVFPHRAAPRNWNELPPGWSIEQVADVISSISTRAFPRVPQLDGFCLLIKRPVIDRIGYLDEEAFPHGFREVYDYSYRAEAAGFELAVADHAYVYHVGHRSYRQEESRPLKDETRQTLIARYGQARIRDTRTFFEQEPTLAAIRQSLAAALQAPR